MDSSAHSPLEGWDWLTSLLNSENLPLPDREVLSETFSKEVYRISLETAASALSEALEGIRQGASIGASRSLGGLQNELATFPNDAANFAELLHQLAIGKTTNRDALRETPVPWVWSTVMMIGSVLEILAYEGDTGRPHPYQSGGL
jgi:hypothetical protein